MNKITWISIYLALLGALVLFGLVGCGKNEVQEFNSCDDGELSGAETDVDCGGPTCDACGLGKACLEGRDCESGFCEGGSCVASECQEGLTQCDGVCVNTQSDPGHCGGCGEACDPGQTCDAGECFGGGTLSISFVAPTEVDGAVLDRDWTEVAVAVTSDSQASAFIDWNNTLAGYWAFNEGDGLAVGDRSSHTNGGSMENGPLWAAGKFGGALSFDGVDDRVVISNDASLDITGPITIEAWIKPAEPQEACDGEGRNRGVVAKCDGEAASENKCSWQFRYGAPGDCYLGFMFKDASGTYQWVTVGRSLAVDQWVHVAGTFDGAEAKCYLDGIETDSAPLAGILGSDARLFVGDGGYGTYFSGVIDEVRIHGRALSAAEVAAARDANSTMTRRFDALAGGSYSYQAFATDVGGNFASTEARTVTVEAGDPCLGVACSDHGTCVLVGEQASCVCDPGYHDEGLECVEDGEVIEDPVYTPTYFVSTSGDDSSSGTDPDHPWETLAKVESMASTFVPGDVIAFKRGDAWYESLRYGGPDGSSSDPIIFTSYGTGERPVISGWGVFSGTWEDQGNNKWRMASSGASRLWKDDVEMKKTCNVSFGHAWDEFGPEYTWLYDEGYFYHYSVTDPNSSVFSGSVRYTLMGFNDKSYIDIVGMAVEYGGHAVDVDNGSHMRIRYCTLGKGCGKAISANDSDNFLVERCTIDADFRLKFEGVESYTGTDYRGVSDAIGGYGDCTAWEIRYNDFINWAHAGYGARANYTRIHHNYFNSPDLDYSRAVGWSYDNLSHHIEFDHNVIENMHTQSQPCGANNHIHHNWFLNGKDTPLKSGEEGYGIAISSIGTDAHDILIEYNTFQDYTAPGFSFVAAGFGGAPTVYENVVHKNLFIRCGTDAHYSSMQDIYLSAPYYSDIGHNTYTDNAFEVSSTTDVILHRGESCTASEFNARDGITYDVDGHGGNNDTISGNTTTITDQGAGPLDMSKVGVRGTE